MNDTIQKIADDLKALAIHTADHGISGWNGHDKINVIASRLRALSARASAGEGGTDEMVWGAQKYLAEHHPWYAPSTSDEVRELLKASLPNTATSPATACTHEWFPDPDLGEGSGYLYCRKCDVTRRAPKDAAPQPAQAGASGGGDYSQCCDTPAYCSSVRRRTAKDAPASPATGESSPFTCDECGKVECCPEFHESPQPAAAQGGMAFAFMAEVCDAAVQAMQASGLIKRTIRLQEVRDQLRMIAAAPQPQEAPAQATDFARGLAEHDAKLYGTGFLVDGVRVAPDRIEIIAAAPQPQTPCSDYPNCPNLACPPGCAKPSTPPAHGDGEVIERAARWMRLLRDATNQEHEIAMLDAILAALTTRPTPEAQEAKWRCECCATHEVELALTCHNSSCERYAAEVSVYCGWKDAARAVPTQEARDAARYRWLRDNNDLYGLRITKWDKTIREPLYPSPTLADALIDAALALPAQGEGNNG